YDRERMPPEPREEFLARSKELDFTDRAKLCQQKGHDFSGIADIVDHCYGVSVAVHISRPFHETKCTRISISVLADVHQHYPRPGGGLKGLLQKCGCKKLST